MKVDMGVVLKLNGCLDVMNGNGGCLMCRKFCYDRVPQQCSLHLDVFIFLNDGKVGISVCVHGAMVAATEKLMVTEYIIRNLGGWEGSNRKKQGIFMCNN